MDENKKQSSGGQRSRGRGKPRPSSPRTSPPRKSPPRTLPPRKSPPRTSPPRTSSSPGRSPSRSQSSARPKPKVINPIIGIPCSFAHHPNRDEQDQQYFYVYRPYVSAIFDSGGTPILLPVGLEGKFLSKVYSLLDGLLLPGGVDIDPAYYGDFPHDGLQKVDPRKDRTEIEIFKLAFNTNMPILGICRGVQVINAALDGSLFQDISSQVRMSMNHHPKFPQNENVHKVEIEKDSKLYDIIGEREIWVNSMHHQSVKLHGKGLLVNAKAHDGITEGLEHPAKKWVIGVQWHPELLYKNDKASAKLFKAFIDACKG